MIQSGQTWYVSLPSEQHRTRPTTRVYTCVCVESGDGYIDRQTDAQHTDT